MTVPATTRRAGPFTGNGVTTSFPFTFKVFEAEDIQFTTADADGLETLRVLDSDYSVTLNPDQDASPGGSVTYPLSGTPLASGHTAAISGAVEYTQELDLPGGGSFSPTALENALDRTTMQVQQLVEEVGRSLTLPVTAAGADTELPAPEAGKVIGWDAAGLALQNYDPAAAFTAAAFANWVAESFTGDGITTRFTLTSAPGSLGNIDVSIAGVTQVATTDYSLAGNLLTFLTAPPDESVIFVRYGAAAVQTASTSFESQTVLAGATVVTLASSTYTPGTNNVLVVADGIVLTPGVDYTETSETSITLAAATTGSTDFLFITGRVIEASGNTAETTTFSESAAYSSGTVGWALRSLNNGRSLLRYIPTALWSGVLDGTTSTDMTSYIAAALAAEDVIEVPAGAVIGQWDLTALRGKTIRGAGRDRTTLKNVGNAPVFKLNNTGGDCKLNTLSDFRIMNRDSAVYTTADGIEIDGNSTNENDFHTFQRLEILQMRDNISIKNRTVWNTWIDVHSAAALRDDFRLDTTENVSEQLFLTCRFGTAVGYGIYLNKASGDALSGWTFINCTSEKNGLNGLRISGASSGVAGFNWIGGYMEENTTSVAPAATNPRKANIFVDASLCLDFNVTGSALYGTPLADPLDWGVYISSATASGYISIRPGAFALGMANLPTGFMVGPRNGGTTTVTKAAGSLDFNELVSEATGSDTLTLTGCTTSPTGTAIGVAQKKQVTLYLPTITGTSNTTAATLTGLSSGFWPARTQTLITRVTDNGTTVAGLAQIGTSGVITLYSNLGGAGFTGSGTKGVQVQTLTYSLE